MRFIRLQQGSEKRYRFSSPCQSPRPASPRTDDVLAAFSLHRRPQQTLTKTQSLFLVKTDEKVMKSGVGKRMTAVEIVLRD